MRYLLRLTLLLSLFSPTLAGNPSHDVNPSRAILRGHVSYLASEKLMGRRTGSEGAELACQYIETEFKRHGLKPLSAGYRQSFPYLTSARLGTNNELSFNWHDNNRVDSMDLRINEDFMVHALGSNASLNLPVTFVSYGISKKPQHDDYQLDVKGRVVIALSGSPLKELDDLATVRAKAIAAEREGARALVLISKERDFSFDPLSRIRLEPSGEVRIPVVAISRQSAFRLLGQEAERLRPFHLPSVTFRIKTNLDKRYVVASNVAGLLEGSDPLLKHEAIIVGAHYDHLGHGGRGSAVDSMGEIHFGADDNASGVAGMLELSRILSNNRARLRRSVLFIAFAAEEEGLIGSGYYVNNSLFPMERTVAMINLDMIGRLRDNLLMIGGVGSSPLWTTLLARVNSVEEKELLANLYPQNFSSTRDLTDQSNSLGKKRRFNLSLSLAGTGRSDHSSFYSKHKPVLFFFTGLHGDYHRPTDTEDRINYSGQERIVAFIRDLLDSIDASDKPVPFSQHN
jgi:aminopeptidase YwaD